MVQNETGQKILLVSVEEAYEALPIIPWWFFATKDVVRFMSESNNWSVFGMKELNRVFAGYSVVDVLEAVSNSPYFNLDDEYFAFDEEGTLTSLDEEGLEDVMIGLFRNQPDVSVSLIKWAYTEGLRDNVQNYFRCLSNRLNAHWEVDRVDIFIGDEALEGQVHN